MVVKLFDKTLMTLGVDQVVLPVGRCAVGFLVLCVVVVGCWCVAVGFVFLLFCLGIFAD